MKGSIVLLLLGVVCMATAAERVVLFEEYTQTG
jgi:hypothetical protein